MTYEGKKSKEWKIVLDSLRQEWRIYSLAMICSAISRSANGASLWIIKPIVDQVLIGKQYERTFPLIYQFLLLTFFSAIFYFFENYLSAMAGNRLAYRQRQKIFTHLQTLSLGFYTSTRMGEILSRFTADLEVIQGFYVNTLRNFFALPIEILVGLLIILRASWRLTLLSFLIFPAAGFLVLLTGRRMKKAARKARMKIADIMSFLQEAIMGMKIIQLFTLEKMKEEKFAYHNIESYRAVMKEALIRSFSTPLIILLGGITISAILLMSILESRLSPSFATGDMMAFVMILINMVVNPLRRVNEVNMAYQQARVANRRIEELSDAGPTIQEAPDAIVLPKIYGTIEFQGIHFAYDETTPVFRDFNLRIPAGKTVALVGPSGAGKSTLINLLLRFYDPQEGVILLDGVDTRRLRLDFLRKIMGVVPQETILFNTTVRENILLGKPNATLDEVIKAAQAAHAHEFIQSLPQGYESMVGERGSALSGGQQQRIAIARALLKDPPILILDEAVSGVDTDSEVKIQEAIQQAFRGRTAIIIAHRLSTARRADLIAVIDSGKLVEMGTHDELMAQNGYYHKLYDAQFLAKKEMIIG